MAHILANDLRAAVLKAAIQGRLTKHNDSDTNVIKTIKQIKDEKTYLFKSKKINKEKPFSKSDKYVETPFDIPDTWEWIRFGDLMINKDSYRVPVSKAERAKKEKVYDYYGASGVIDKIDSYIFDEPNLLIGEDGANLLSRSTPIAFVAHGKYWVNNHAHVLNTCAGVSLKFVTLYINAIDLSPYVSGTAQPKMNQENMNAIWVALPPIEEQARIVAKVDEIMAKIDEYEKLENQLVKLKEQFPQDMKDSLLQAGMMGKLTEQYHSEHSPLRNLKNDASEYDSDLPSNWSVAKMMTISELYTGNSISESIKKSKYTGLSSGYNYIGTKDVGFDCSITYNNGVKIPYDEPKFKIAKKHSTLLCIEGGSAGKKVGITSEDVCFGNKLCSFNAREYINYKFQFYVIQSPTFKKVFIQNKSGMIGGVSIKKLKEILIPLPPIEEQQRIVDKLDELLPLVDKLAELN